MKKSKKDKKASLVLVGCMFVGGGIGMMFGEAGIGFVLGLGVGFLGMYVVSR